MGEPSMGRNGYWYAGAYWEPHWAANTWEAIYRGVRLLVRFVPHANGYEWEWIAYADEPDPARGYMHGKGDAMERAVAQARGPQEVIA